MELLSPKPRIEPTVIRQIVVRPARKSDHDRVMFLNQMCFGDVMCHWQSGQKVQWDVADTELGIAGFSVVSLIGPRVYIERIAVYADCRGQGIGSALIEGIVARAKLHRLKRVICLSSEFAPASTHKFLAGRGFWSQVHPVPERLRRPIDAPASETRRGVYIFSREIES